MKRSSTLLLIALPLCLLAQDNQKLNHLFEQAQAIDEQYENTNSIYKGQHPETFTYVTAEQKKEKAEQLRPILNELEAIADNLSEQDEINRQIRILQLKDQLSEVDFNMFLIPLNAEGGFYTSPAFFLSRLPFKNEADYEAYLKWLPSFADYLDYNQSLMAEGIEKGILLPKVLVRNHLSLIQPWVAKPEDHPFYQPLKQMPASISAQRQSQLQVETRRILRESTIPVYQSLKTFLQGDYLSSAPEQVGVSALPNGAAYYEQRVQHFTTLDLTPDSVFAAGQAEVIRIGASMEQIIEEVAFDGDFAAFLEFLRTDPQFYPKTAQELLDRAAWMSKQAEGQLPRLFSKLYELPFTVEAVPDNIAPNYTAGRYRGGSKEQKQPGTYWVNTYKLDSRTLYTLPALTVHEAVPGHHLQNAIANELEGLPEFREGYYISAFGEGWGLYSEYLGEEMGMYTTPYELFGRYTYEMWRACRLVVDVGMHYKGWTREQAVTFMAENTALSLHEVNTEIDRYIGWPGQALSYKIGEITIKRLREQAEEALGDKFDIQAFHYEILRDGAVPLPILENRISNFIRSNQ